MKSIDITFDSLEEQGYESVTDFCRYLVSTGGKFEGIKVQVWRGEMLCLTVSDIYEAAKLQVEENKLRGPYFTKYKPVKKMTDEVRAILALKRAEKRSTSIRTAI